MSKKWTKERIDEALSILSRNHDYSQALDALDESSNSLGSAFQRAGLEAPTTYLADTAEEANFRQTNQPPEGVRTIVVANDHHVPFHNKAGVENWLNFCRDQQPDIIVLNGDFLDCYSISRFNKEPGMPSLQDEIDEGLAVLEKLRRYCPTAELWYTEGNHEARLKHLIKVQHGLYGLKAFELESLLEFDRLGINYKDYGDILFFGDLAIYHGEVTRSRSGYSARGELEKGGFKNIITGHTHRMGFYMQKTYTGNRQALENGGLFDIEQCEYALNPNWQNGFCIVHQKEDTGWMQINPIYVQYDGSFMWNNKIYGEPETTTTTN